MQGQSGDRHMLQKRPWILGAAGAGRSELVGHHLVHLGSHLLVALSELFLLLPFGTCVIGDSQPRALFILQLRNINMQRGNTPCSRPRRGERGPGPGLGSTHSESRMLLPITLSRNGLPLKWGALGPSRRFRVRSRARTAVFCC